MKTVKKINKSTFLKYTCIDQFYRVSRSGFNLHKTLIGISLFLFTTAMNILNKVSLKYISALAVAAILFILTVQSKDKHSFYYSFHTLLTSRQDTIIPANKKNINAGKKPI